MTATPGGYVPLHIGRARAVVRSDAAEALHRALATATLHQFASRHAARRELHGRGTAYAIPLGDGMRVVVRHNQHGGALARLTGDRFLAPTRAPLELATSLQLMAAGVATPPVIAIVRYAAGGPFERADVATALIEDATDLAHLLRHQPELQLAAARATGTLLRALAAAQAQHEDLNIKNVLVRRTGSVVDALVLDVDRVVFRRDGAQATMAANWRRFERSVRKWRSRHGMTIGDEWMAAVRDAANPVS